MYGRGDIRLKDTFDSPLIEKYEWFEGKEYILAELCQENMLFEPFTDSDITYLMKKLQSIGWVESELC